MKRLTPDEADARYIRRLLWTILIVAVLAALFLARDLLILAFGSVLLAVAIRAVADVYGDRLRLPERAAMALAIGSLLAFLGVLGWLFGVEFRQQVNTLVVELPGLLGGLQAYMRQSPVGAAIADAVRAAFAGSRIAQDIGGLARGAGELMLNAVLVLFGAIFFAVSPARYERGLLLLVPRRYRPAMAEALDDVGSTLVLWLRAQLIQMIAMGTMVGVGLWLVGVPSPALLGLLTGLSEFIPYVGPLAAMLPAIGLAATQGVDQLLYALAVFAVVRVVQTNLVTPFVTSRVVAIPPALSLFAIIGTGAVFGLFGLFFSGGILVVAFALVRSLYLREVLGEDIAPVRDRKLFKRTPARSDSPENLA